MKKSYWIVLVLAVAVIGAFVINHGVAQEKPAPPAAKVAVCDVLQVFRNYQRAKDLTEGLKTRVETVKAESDSRGKAIDKLQDEMDRLKIDSKEYNDRLNEKTRLTIERQAYLATQDELAKRENFRLTKDMYTDVLAAVEKVAKARGYDVVLFKESPDLQSQNLEELLQQMARRKVLYSEPSLDITEEVLLRLNEDFKAKKS